MWFILYRLWARHSSVPFHLPNKNKDTRTFFQGQEAPSSKPFWLGWTAGPSVRKRKANPSQKFMEKKKKAFTGAAILFIVYHRNPTIHQLIYSNQTHKLIYHISPQMYHIKIDTFVGDLLSWQVYPYKQEYKIPCTLARISCNNGRKYHVNVLYVIIIKLTHKFRKHRQEHEHN